MDINSNYNYIYECDPDETEHVIKTADDVCRHSFLFDMEWDMERTYIPVEFGEKIDWEYNPGTDPEFTWQFNRHRFLICLAQSYKITGNVKYAECMVDLIKQFMVHIKETGIENLRMASFRILEIGIRAANWVTALNILGDYEGLSAELKMEICDFLKEHARILIDEHYAYCYAGNWGILENHGLYVLGALMPIVFGKECEKDAASYRKQAMDVLTNGLKMQVLPDGIQLEQSCMYHIEVLKCALEVILYAQRYGYPVNKILEDKVRSMTEAALWYRRPDGYELSMGDSDYMNLRSIFALAAVVFSDGEYKWAAEAKLYFDNLWLMSDDEVKKYDSIAASVPEEELKEFPDGGHFFIRKGWGKDSDYLHFDAGLLGTSHGHNDILHTDLILNGRDVLVDIGRFTYEMGEDRMEFRGTSGHNTIRVDKMEVNDWENSWFTKSLASQNHSRLIYRDNCAYMQASHTGYMRLGNPVHASRKLIVISDDIFIWADECYTSGSHFYEHFWHFDYKGRLSLVNSERVRFESADTSADFFFDKRGNVELYDSRQSLHYNQFEANKTVCVSMNNTGFHSMNTVCIRSAAGGDYVENLPVKLHMNGENLPSELAEGLKIKHGDKTYLVIIAHTEMPAPVTLYKIEDYMGCGNVIIFDTDKDMHDAVVLNW